MNRDSVGRLVAKGVHPTFSPEERVLTVADALLAGRTRLMACGVDSPALDVRLLLGHAMGVDQAALLRERGTAAPIAALAAFARLLERRAGREPMAFILGRQGFWTLDLAVSRDTLIPRADSEALVEAVLAARPDRAVAGRVLDLGTGTGCLLLAVLSEYPAAWGVGVDLAPAAAALAARNAGALGMAGRAAFLAGDWAAAVSGRFDIILSNPPYIRAGEVDGLMPEVARWEPRRALDGGADGLAAYRAVLADLPRLLAPGGVAAVELGEGQAEAVVALAEMAGFVPRLRADLAGVQRALVLEKRVGIGAYGD